MTTEDKVLDQLSEMDADKPSYDELASMLTRYVELDALLRPMKEEMESIKTVLKAHIEEQHEPIVTDSGWVASLREKNKPRTVDVISFARKHPEYLAELGQAGVLSASLTQLNGLKGKSAAADEMNNNYVMHGGSTHEFRVERP